MQYARMQKYVSSPLQCHPHTYVRCSFDILVGKCIYIYININL